MIARFFCLIAFGILCGLAGCQSALQSYKNAEKQYEIGEYELAIKGLKQATGQDPARVNWLLAESYRRSNRPQPALDFYQKALEAGSKEPTLPLYYGLALKASGKYPEAATQLRKFMQVSKTNRGLVAQARKEIENISFLDSLKAIATPYKIETVKNLNTTGAEFAPVIMGNDLVFTSSRKAVGYKATGQQMLGLYKTNLKSPTEASKAEVFDNNIFADNVNEGSPTFSKDGKTMIFARGNTGRTKGKGNTSADVDLYISRNNGSAWGEPERLAFSDSASWDGSPAFSADGKTLYFCSNRAGGSGGLDLWRINLDNVGRFGRAANMGKDLNSPGNEMFPHVSPDAKLYFASDGHAGLGGLDLFVAERNDGVISVRNLGQPFNTTADDFGLVWADTTRGYFASNREGGSGDDDIYFVETTLQPKPVTTTPDIAKVPNTTDPLNPTNPTNGQNPQKKVVRYFLSGRITDTQTQAPLAGVNVQVLDDENQPVGSGITSPDGTFPKLPIRIGRDYTLVLEKEAYLKKQELFITDGKEIPTEKLTKPLTDTTLVALVDMLRKEIGVELTKAFNIETIYYDLDKDNIRSDASVELDKVVKILQDNPDIKLELGSHTDVRGGDTYNQRLSQRRSESAVRYILSRGIGQERISAKGYGETVLIVANAQTEDEHQLNRRTEFKVVSVQ